MAILASVLVVASVVTAVAGISCYDNSASTTVSGTSSSVAGGYGYGGSAASSRTSQILNNCASCQKYTTMYNMPGYNNYNDVRYSCVTATNSQNNCQGTVTITAYTDGTVYSRSCSCCTNNCNSESYCTQYDSSMTNALSIGGSLGRCNGGNAPTISVGLISTVVLGAAVLLL